jgi:hypothetical protein
MHLSAAGLPRMKLELHTQALKQPDHGATRFREKGVVVAGNE